MELWVRSQDEIHLLKCTDIAINEIKINGFSEGYQIVNYFGDISKYEILGIYQTEERAVEILDEITDLLEQEELLQIMKSSLNNLDEMAEPKYILKPVVQPRVYQMPLK